MQIINFIIIIKVITIIISFKTYFGLVNLVIITANLET